MTGDGRVKQLSNPIQKRGKMIEGKVPNKECVLFDYGRHSHENFTQ